LGRKRTKIRKTKHNNKNSNKIWIKYSISLQQTCQKVINAINAKKLLLQSLQSSADSAIIISAGMMYWHKSMDANSWLVSMREEEILINIFSKERKR
jgi:hypothetical protein